MPARSTRSPRSTSAASARSTCKGEFDRHPRCGPLPAGAPPVCEVFRQLARRAGARRRARRRNTARNPDLEEMPMYGVVFSFKDPFDTKDMRSTGGGDAAYDIDFPARDHVLVEQLAQQGRDHLRQGGQHRIQRPRRRSRRPAQAGQGAALDARLPAQHLGRQPVQSLRHDARRLARLQLRLGAVGQRQSGAWRASARRPARRAAARPTTIRSR